MYSWASKLEAGGYQSLTGLVSGLCLLHRIVAERNIKCYQCFWKPVDHIKHSSGSRFVYIFKGHQWKLGSCRRRAVRLEALSIVQTDLWPARSFLEPALSYLQCGRTCAGQRGRYTRDAPGGVGALNATTALALKTETGTCRFTGQSQRLTAQWNTLFLCFCSPKRLTWGL